MPDRQLDDEQHAINLCKDLLKSSANSDIFEILYLYFNNMRKDHLWIIILATKSKSVEEFSELVRRVKQKPIIYSIDKDIGILSPEF